MVSIREISAVNIVREYGPWEGVDSVHGVTFDGARIWIAAKDRLLAIDTLRGEPVASFDMEARAGTAFDGRYLYQIGDGVIRKVEPSSGRVLTTIPVTGDGAVSGMAWSDGSLWIGRDHDRRIDRIDPLTGELLRSIKVDQIVTGVTWDGIELWHGSWDDEGSALYHVDAATGGTLELMQFERGIGVTGLEANGRGAFLCGGGPSGTVRAIRRGSVGAKV